MKIGILHDSYEQSDSPMKDWDLPCDPAPYLPEHECHRVVIRKDTAVRQIIGLAKQGFDVFINLCDGAWDEDRPGIEVVQALERLGCAYTGATPEFFEPSREAMKRVCHYWGIGTPGYCFALTQPDVAGALRTLRFPMIVKHPSSYSSVGLTAASRVTCESDLLEQTRIMIEHFGWALIEEFIDGREFSVLVAENDLNPADPVAYQPVEFLFPQGESFKHFDMKWVNPLDMSCRRVDDEGLSLRLKEISKRFFVGLNGAGYGRCDIRMDRAGNLYMLEINPNCGIFYPEINPGSADLILLADPAGHRGFLEQILRAAVMRRERARSKIEVRFVLSRGYGAFAARALMPGDVIELLEEQPVHLVSRAHVEKWWDGEKREWFRRYACPVSEGVWAIWHPDPEKWRPINHSCDPNAWLDGLNLTARKPILPGDEITMDYSTFCGEEMESFECSCGAPSCRGIVRGEDCLEPFVESYGEHVSDYVRQRRRGLRRAGI